MNKKLAVRIFWLAAILTVVAVATSGSVAQGQFCPPFCPPQSPTQLPRALVGGFGEELTPEGKSLILYLETEERYSIPNSFIIELVGEIRVDHNRRAIQIGPLLVVIRLSFGGLQCFLPGGCFAPAEAAWNFRGLVEDRYQFEVMGFGRYTLEVAPDRLKLEPKTQQNIRLEPLELRRLPQGILWARIKPEEERWVQAFIQDLQSRGAEAIVLPSGAYRVHGAKFSDAFDVDAQGVARSGQERLWTFRFADYQDAQKVQDFLYQAKQLVCIYKQLFSVEVDLRTWQGERVAGCPG